MYYLNFLSSDDALEVEGRVDQKGGPLPQSFLPWLIEKFRRYIYPEAKVVEAGAYEKDPGVNIMFRI